ncbi:MAG: sigma-70 family RNA polymerase sigma factor [Deltaproteobacteria bacterium]|nr:sigma-70 family RNA polymerase sigma factor [Deltaproteobacteria bacterium]
MKKEISKEVAEKLFHEQSAYVYRIALFLTKSKVLADDITQETMIQVFRKYHLYDATKPIAPWIYKITLNITRNMLRKQRWLKFIGIRPDPGTTDITEQTILKSEEERELFRLINNLNFKSREIIILHFYNGMNLNHMADILGVPLGTCKSRLNNALKTLRRQLPENDFLLLGKGGNIYETL